MNIYNYKIPTNLSNMRLDKVLSELNSELSRSNIQKSIKKGYVKLNKVIIHNSATKVKENDEVELINIEAPIFAVKATNIKLNILYEDEALIVINKPPGLTVHPGAGFHQDTLTNALIYHTTSLSDIGGSIRPGIVHRLDKDTSGLMVVAKNNFAHVSLAKQIERRELVRKYQALIWGVINPNSGTIKVNIGRNKILRQKMSAMKEGGKVAITHYKILEVFLNGAISLVECKLETGRTHQIRVHLSHIGHSIIGDQTYGNNKKKINNLPSTVSEVIVNFQRQALHSYYISFTHPFTKQLLNFEVRLPEDIQTIINNIQEI